MRTRLSLGCIVLWQQDLTTGRDRCFRLLTQLRVFDLVYFQNKIEHGVCTLRVEFQTLLLNGQFFQFRASLNPAQESGTAAGIKDGWPRR